MENSKRRLSRTLLAGLVLAAAGICAHAQSRNIRFIVPYGAGSGTDSLAREIALGVEKVLGETIVVENRPGAGNVIAVEAVLAAPADGRTVLIGPPTLWSAPLVNKKLRFSPLRDFIPVSTLARGPFVLLGSPHYKAATIQEVIADVRANPRKVNAGNNGVGGSPHLMTALFANSAQMDLSYVPYLSGPNVAAALMAGDVQLFMDIPVTAKPMIDSGRLRGLAISSGVRESYLPNVPTFKEAGFPELEVYWYIGTLVKAGTPPSVVQNLSAAINEVLRSPALREKQLRLGVEVRGSTPEQFTEIIRTDTRRWQDVVNRTGITVD
ncbi:MAG: tripartite tricarboxylate transporter substrate binding protein [Burkholderiaceae bacterium]|nr:tripartite tricarboxylate transporter substrate binding protein [Burkholderiaceae bacterium]MDO9088685.1 tripartite tricarboxylate transporter substrate binding protein [Burkholderiaceae bacterium]